MKFIVKVNKVEEAIEAKDFVGSLRDALKKIDKRLFFSVFDPENLDMIDIEFDVPHEWYPESMDDDDIAQGVYFKWSSINPKYEQDYKKLLQKVSREVTKLASEFDLALKVIPSRTSYCLATIQF